MSNFSIFSKVWMFRLTRKSTEVMVQGVFKIGNDLNRMINKQINSNKNWFYSLSDRTENLQLSFSIHKRTKHVDIRNQSIREKCQDVTINGTTEYQLKCKRSFFFTEALPKQRFHKLGIISGKFPRVLTLGI